MNDNFLKFFSDLYNNPLFKRSFTDYFMYMQKEGLEGARKYWSVLPQESKLFENAPMMFEQMIELFTGLGYVPRKKYEKLLQEKEELEKENEFLKDTIQKLNLKVMTEGGIKMQGMWKDTIDKQVELSRELAKNFFEVFKRSDKK